MGEVNVIETEVEKDKDVTDLVIEGGNIIND
jgi:hypothetical protein